MNLRLLAAVALAAPAALHAQTTPTTAGYPSKAVRIIVGFPPGGGTDKFARLIGPKLSASFGQPVVIDNRPGAGGIVGSELVAKSAPDGHTVLVTTSGYVITAALHAKLPFDPVTSLAPVTMFATTPSVLLVHPSVPAKSVKELIAFAKLNPGRLNYGSTGNGSPYHIATEMFKSMAGVNFAHVPYKGAAPAIIAALSGEVALVFANIVSGLPHARSGRMRALAVTPRTRSPIAPELPTMAEAGVPGYEFTTWFGALVPSGTPQNIVQRLHGEIKNAVNAPEIRAAFIADGADTHDTTPEAYAQIIKADIQSFTKLAKRVGMSVD